jgi:ceramide glucosyltransferase
MFTAIAILLALSVLLTTAQALLTWRYRVPRRLIGERRGRPHFVSILKPVCGLDDELEENLVSFAKIRGVPYEVIISVADGNDPAIAAIERVRAAYPLAPFRVVVGGDPRLELGNRKVARLIAAAGQASGDLLLISDSNVRTAPDDVARTIATFDEPRVGCVSNLFTGAGSRNIGASIEMLHLLSFVVPGTVLAASAGVPCVVGKSMAISREALAAVGGFEAFANVLAEDQALGLAVRRAGFAVALSPVVVRNVIVQRTLRRAVQRQVRWNKIRYAFSRSAYTAELLINPLPFAIAAAIAGPFAILPLTIVLRIAQVAILAAATDGPIRGRDLALVPLLDLLQFGAQFVPYLDDTVEWRGHPMRIGRNTVLLEA